MLNPNFNGFEMSGNQLHQEGFEKKKKICRTNAIRGFLKATNFSDGHKKAEQIFKRYIDYVHLPLKKLQKCPYKIQADFQQL